MKNGAAQWPYSTEDFVRESNRIESIHREPTRDEVRATAAFCGLKILQVSALVELVETYQPDARPRFAQGLDVRVGNHIPPRGGPHIQQALVELLAAVSAGGMDAYTAHVAYETLHPFTDGNGRSGRAVWLWCMGGIHKAPLGFLHHFYYQTLGNSRPPSTKATKT